MTRVLVVDDDRDVAESLGMVLEGMACQVDLAFSGSDAVSMFRPDRHDLVLMDVRMPGMNGVEALLEIRAQHPNARVMMMTGYSVEQLLTKAREHGAVGVLRKPIGRVDLQRMVAEVRSAPR